MNIMSCIVMHDTLNIKFASGSTNKSSVAHVHILCPKQDNCKKNLDMDAISIFVLK